MADTNSEMSSLQNILDHTVETIKSSKEEIYVIYENTRAERDKLLLELEKYNKEIVEVIDSADDLEVKCKIARKKLAHVHKNFGSHNEEDIQMTYEKVSELHIELSLVKEREKFLQNMRNDLQQRIKNINITVERSELLITQISVVYSYLNNEVSDSMNQIVETNKEQQLIGYKTIIVHEDEKKRIARDIHDGPAQSMANVVLRAEITERLIANEDFNMAKSELKDLKKMVKQNLADVRQIIFDLRPSALDDLGLFPTLKKYIPEVMKRKNIDIEFKIIGTEKRLSSPLEIAAFRLIQEGLNNVIRHAKADKVKVCIQITDIDMEISIFDNGIGFNTEEVKNIKEHFGLLGMKERVELFKGDLNIESNIGKGTKITFKIPINEGWE